jgi:hypothetical protein
VVVAHRQDPGGVVLRRALRVAVVMPVVLVITVVVLGDGVMALYAAFGTFALLVFSDFAGPLSTRSAATVITGVVGGLGVVLGTLVAPWPWAAAGAALLVGSPSRCRCCAVTAAARCACLRPRRDQRSRRPDHSAPG